MEITSRKILIFIGIGLLLALAVSQGISRRLASVVAVETRERELALLYGAIEAGPLAIARLQASAISQQELARLMGNPQLAGRGILSAKIEGGPDFSYTFAEWKSSEAVKDNCLKSFEKQFTFVDALNPFRVTILRNDCQLLKEQREILSYSSVASLIITLSTIALLALCVWPVASSIRTAEDAFKNRFKEVGKISFKPIQNLLREAIRSVELEREQALTTIAQQVSHDIRSPLSALNVAIASIKSIPEEQMRLVQTATTRINAIADELIGKRKNLKSSGAELIQLKSMIDDLIAEKQIQLSNKPGIKFKANFNSDYELKLPIKQVTLERVLSNLMNNSIEALSNDGTITLAVRTTERNTEIIVADNGKGIPTEILDKMSHQNVSYGKATGSSGSGLGLLHARRSVEEVGGVLAIQSAVGIGTQVRMTFPR